MAKKKGRRTANVARKREKRNRDRKSRQKQIAIEKQRRLPYERSEKEQLHLCISQSRELLNEPELENVHFDFDLMYTWVTDLLDDYETSQENTSLTESNELLELRETSSALDPLAQVMHERAKQIQQMEQAERACEHFRTQILPHLVTPEFMQELIRALRGCETRLKLERNREMAKVARVARSIFEVAPPEMLVFHPLIQSIGIQTLRQIVTEPNTMMEAREDVKHIISNVLEYEEVTDYNEIDITEEMTVELRNQSEIAGSEPEKKTDALPAFSKIAENQLDYIEAEKDLPRSAVFSQKLESEISRSIVTEETASDDKKLPLADTPESPPASMSDTHPPHPDVPSEENSSDTFSAHALYKNFHGLAIREIFEVDPAFTLEDETEKQIRFANVKSTYDIIVTDDRLHLQACSEPELTVAMNEVESQCKSALMYLAKTIRLKA